MTDEPDNVIAFGGGRKAGKTTAKDAAEAKAFAKFKADAEARKRAEAEESEADPETWTPVEMFRALADAYDNNGLLELQGAVVAFRVKAGPDHFVTGFKMAGFRMSEALPVLDVTHARLLRVLSEG